MLGDSIIKHVDDYLFDLLPFLEIEIICLRGKRIEGLSSAISSLKNKYDWIVVHVGTKIPMWIQ